MVKTILLATLSILFVFSSCNEGINIQGKIEGNNYDGETAHLYMIKSDSLTSPLLLAKAVVENGEFSFSDIEDNQLLAATDLPTIAFVSLFDLFASDQADDPIELPVATVILEKGTTTITFDGASVVLSGTPNNEKFNLLHRTITDIAELAEQKREFGEIDNLPIDSQGRDGRAQLQHLNQQFRELTFDFAKDNMTNNVGHFLFYSYAEGMFTPTQIKELIDISSQDFKDKKEIKELSAVLATMNEGIQ